MKKVLLLILCSVMLLMALHSCAKPEEEPAENPVGSQQNGGPEQNGDYGKAGVFPAGGAFDVAFATFPPETVMMRAQGLEVTWAELFVHLRTMVGNLSDYYDGEPIDWSASWDYDITSAEWVIQYAIDEALFTKALEYGAGLYGVALGEADWALMREENDDIALEWGGEEAFHEMLWEEKGFINLELFEYMKSFSRLSELLLMEIFGAELELMSDEDVGAFVVDDGLIMARHIFLYKPEFGGYDDALGRIEGILFELKAYSGDDFSAFFNDLMHTHSEDAIGLERLPNGYLFRYGDLTPYFYDAAIALDIYELSEVVDGEDGYHIIYRIPLDLDSIPFSYIIDEDYRTLRMLVAFAKFDQIVDGWLNLLELEYTKEFESIDVAVMFKDA